MNKMVKQKNLTNNRDLRVSYAAAVHDDAETQRVLAVLNEHRTIMGRETEEFERRVAKFFSRKYGVMVNSGSSANLIAIELANLPEGSEVITPILTFSTTVSPLVHKKLVPVFADVEEGKYTININQIEELISPKTKALLIPLLFGSVPDMVRLKKIAKKYNLILIDDSCDTFASSFNEQPTSSFTDITTTSFYGSHIITAGGTGGMVLFDKDEWKDKAKVLRGWGRSSSIFNESEDIRVRFQAKVDGIQYDTKFVFSDPGYNLLPIEIGSAFGNAQLDKITLFRKKREKNFTRLLKFFRKYTHWFTLPIQEENVKTWWLAFPLTIKEGTPFTRLEIMTYLEENNIQTRPIFTGNILRQPGFAHIKHRKIKNYSYHVANNIMERGFVVGCHHGMEEEHLARLEEAFTSFLKKYTHSEKLLVNSTSLA